MTSNTNRNNYPDNRLVVRDIWTEGGRRNVTALQSAHIIDYAQYMLSQQNTDMLSIQEIFTVLRNLRRKVCRKGMVTLGLTHKASSCSRWRNTVEWEDDCVCMLCMLCTCGTAAGNHRMFGSCGLFVQYLQNVPQKACYRTLLR